MFPYTALVGAVELGYDVERPIYKRRPRSTPLKNFRIARACVCDDLVRRVIGLRDADPPLDLMSHPTSRALVDEHSPVASRLYKYR